MNHPLNAYQALRAEVRADPDRYWLEITRKRLLWRTPPTRGLEGNFRTITEEPIRWFSDGVLNVTESCVDRHAAARPADLALIWEGDEPGDVRRITWAELQDSVCRAANTLTSLGVHKGDRVVIYMGMVPEAAVAMLACARIGAVHSVVFGGFSAESLRDRISDCSARLVITQDEGRRGGRSIPLKRTVDEALLTCDSVRHVLVFARTHADVPMTPGRDVRWADTVDTAAATHEAVACAAEDPLFILYTSGSTGRPKGLLHTQAGYLTWASYTHDLVFGPRPGEIFACMADIGWVTGHSYIVYGPLCNGITSVLFESIPTYPDPGRYWDVVARLGVNILYTAPTALRALAAQGDRWVYAHDRRTLRVLGTVGEPINPDAWRWYHDVVGEGRCPVVDTWWQTETGGILLSPIAGITTLKPGAATLPLPGVEPLLVDADGHRVRGPGEGRLCLEEPWPGMARSIWGDHDRFAQTYFTTFPGLYFTGDGARRDQDGDYWITGRVDDVINVSGHRMGTAEFESALASVAAVAEAAVVGYPHPLKGQGVYAYLVLEPEAVASPEVEQACHEAVRRHIGAHARVDIFQVVPGLPKTRSGKVMRRILRKVAEGETDQIGDISTLADPGVVAAIVAGKLSKAG